MDAPPHHHHRNPALPNGTSAIDPTDEIPPDPSSSAKIDGPQPTKVIAKRKNKKKKQAIVSDCASSASWSNCIGETCCSHQKGVKIIKNQKRIRVGSLMGTRRSVVGPSDVDALGLPLGMSIAAVVAQVLERKKGSGEKMSVDYLSEICILAVRESLGNVFGDKFDNFVANFEKSFRSTLMTLRLISCSSQNVGEQVQTDGFRGCSCSVSSDLSFDKIEDSESPSVARYGAESLPHSNHTKQHLAAGSQDSFPQRNIFNSQMEENVQTNNLMNRQLVLHDKEIGPCLASTSAITSLSNSSIKQNSMLSTIEKSVVEQTRSNDLKTFEIGLTMRKLQLKERELELSSNSNFLERWKISMGLSKASFKAEKFKTQLQDARQVELLKKCLDFLVSGLIIMLLSLAYGTYVFSHRRIIEATEACSPYSESNKSWWMPKSMATFNSGLQLLKCQIQVFSRMLFGVLMIGAIAFLLIQRSATSHQTMPITFILLLLGVACGYAGKFCIDTLGGNGNHWLIYWEVMCLLHFFSNVFHSWLFLILNGPVMIAERVEHSTVFPYWMRRSLFYTTLLFIPLLCGSMPFASPWEWLDHFSLQAEDFMTYIDD